jgi:hypothetical protein
MDNQLNKGLFFTLIVLPFFIMGCTQGNESFSTEPGKGFGWKHMSDTSDAIHRESFYNQGLYNPGSQPRLELPPLRTLPPLGVNTHSGITRIPEQSIKIWLAPYQDEAGNLHEESVVHTVMQSGQWILPPPKPDAVL